MRYVSIQLLECVIPPPPPPATPAPAPSPKKINVMVLARVGWGRVSHSLSTRFYDQKAWQYIGVHTQHGNTLVGRCEGTPLMLSLFCHWLHYWSPASPPNRPEYSNINMIIILRPTGTFLQLSLDLLRPSDLKIFALLAFPADYLRLKGKIHRPFHFQNVWVNQMINHGGACPSFHFCRFEKEAQRQHSISDRLSKLETVGKLL